MYKPNDTRQKKSECNQKPVAQNATSISSFPVWGTTKKLQKYLFNPIAIDVFSFL